MRIRIEADQATTDLMGIQLGAFLFGFFSGMATALMIWWILRELWG